MEVTRDWVMDTMRRFSADSDVCMNEALSSLVRPPLFGGDNARLRCLPDVSFLCSGDII